MPPNWRDFLLDQRGDRKIKALYSERALSLCGVVRDLTVEEKAEQDRVRFKFEAKEKEEKQLLERKRKSDQNVDDLFRKVNIEDNLAEDNPNETKDDDSEWEEESCNKPPPKKRIKQGVKLTIIIY